MTDFAKIHTLHASKFGIKDVNDRFYSLMDRLQKHSEWKFPDRMWSIDTYYGIAFLWVGKDKELEERVLILEKEMYDKINKENIA